MPRGAQEEAFRKGLIPHIPDDQENFSKNKRPIGLQSKGVLKHVIYTII